MARPHDSTTGGRGTAWPEAVRAEALHLYQTVGPAAASRATGVPAATISKWAGARGLSSAAPKTLPRQASMEDLRTRRAALREELQLRMLDTAVGLIRRVNEPHVEYMGAGKDGPTPVHYPVAPGRTAQALVTAAAILLDKYRLEMGEATDRTESGPIPQATGHMTDDDRQALRQWLDSGGMAQLTQPQEGDA